MTQRRNLIWLAIIIVIAIACAQVVLHPIGLASAARTEVPTKILFDTEKTVYGPGRDKDQVERELTGLLEKKIDPAYLRGVKLPESRLIEVSVDAVDRKEYNQWARDAEKILKDNLGNLRRLAGAEEKEKPKARIGPLAMYWPLRPRVKLGLDLQGGSRIVLRLLPTTRFSFTAEQPFFGNDDERLNLVNDVQRSLERQRFSHVSVAAPGEEKKLLEVTVGTTTEAQVKKADNLIREKLESRFQGIKSSRPQSVVLDVKTAEQVVGVVNRRVNSLGVEEATVEKQGKDRVVVSIPGRKDTEHLVNVVKKFARLEFRDIPKQYAVSDSSEPGRVVFEDSVTGKPVSSKKVLAASKYVIGGEDLKPTASLSPDTDAGGQLKAVSFELKPEAAKIFYRHTRANIGRYLAIVLDGEVVSSPVIRGAIRDQGEINGIQTEEEARDLKTWLNAGALPVPLEVAETRTVSATIGKDTVNKSLAAGLWGVLAVAIFMIAFYRYCGLMANLALVVYALLVLAIVVRIPVTLTLPGIAGLILSLGMAVDANVIIFERLREELRTEKGIRGAMEAGFKRAWTAILDCNVTTLIACSVLYLLGTGPVKGFALTLGIGVLCSMFSAITVTRVFLFLSANDKLVHSRAFVKP